VLFYLDNFQSMPLYYNNANADTKYYSETVRTWADPQDLTTGGMTDLSLWFKGRAQKLVQNADGSLVVSSCSGDISGTNNDYFRYVYKKLDGDGSMIIKVDSLTFTANWTKCGIMIRETLDATSARAHTITLANGRIAFENRTTTSGASVSTYTGIGAVPLPVWLKLERAGTQFTGSYSTDGTTWTPVPLSSATASPNPQTITMAGSVLIGLCITSNNAGYAASAAAGVAGYGGLTAIAQISNVKTTGTVTGDWTVADIGTAVQPNGANDADDLYVALQDQSGKIAVVTWPDGAIQPDWTNWVIPLSEFKGVNTSAVTKMFIGVGDRNNPQPDGAGLVLIDNVRVIKR
jgi:regulation of enolase protein 1 (concanavalin A-like superfamily)